MKSTYIILKLVLILTALLNNDHRALNNCNFFAKQILNSCTPKWFLLPDSGLLTNCTIIC